MTSKIKGIVAFALVILINVYLFNSDRLWDLTSDQKYTVSDAAQQKIAEIPTGTVITLLFEGNIPASFKNYKGFIDYYLREVKRINPDIELIFQNPTDGTPEEVASMREYLTSYGVSPVSRRVSKDESISQSLLYPFLSVHNQNRVVFIDLLEAKESDESEEEAILKAQILFESKLLKAFRDISTGSSGLIGILGAENRLLAQGLNNEKGKLGNYFFFPMNGNQIISQLDTLDAIMVLIKDRDLSRVEQLSVDQAIMNSVPVLWMIDKYKASVDSIGIYGEYLALPSEFTVEDMLFKNGVRLSTDLIQSIDCSPIPQVVGQEGGQPKTMLVPFPFHPLCPVEPSILGEIADFVNVKFATPIDTLRTATPIEKSIFLSTTANTLLKSSPVSLDFNFMRFEADRRDYQKGKLPIGIKLEGRFDSYFNNRLTAEDQSMLNQANRQVLNSVDGAVQMVISDMDFALPSIARDGSLYPVGYNFWDRKVYKGNVELIKALLEDMVHGDEFLQFKKKELKTSLIDQDQFEKDKYWYYFLLLGLPVLFVLMTSGLVRLYRSKSYAQ
jgi:ABC-2 type transport system permease protein